MSGKSPKASIRSSAPRGASPKLSKRVSIEAAEPEPRLRSKTVAGTNFQISEALPPAPQEYYTYDSAYDFLDFNYGDFFDSLGRKRKIRNYSMYVIPELAERMEGMPVLRKHNKRIQDKEKDIRKLLKSQDLTPEEFLEWILMTGGK